MNNTWWYIVGIMFVGSMIKGLFDHWLVWIVIDVIVFGISYYLLQRNRFIDIKTNVFLLGGITLVNILVDAGILGGMVANLLVLVFLGWMMFGRR